MPIFSHWKEALFLLKKWNKNWGHRTRFCGRAAESVHQMHFLRFLRGNWGEFQNGIHFYRIYIEISQLGRNVIKMALEFKSKSVSISLTPTIDVLREDAELSNRRTTYVMQIPNTLSLISATNNSKRKF